LWNRGWLLQELLATTACITATTIVVGVAGIVIERVGSASDSVIVIRVGGLFCLRPSPLLSFRRADRSRCRCLLRRHSVGETSSGLRKVGGDSRRNYA
jgi:hypothetical protein